MKKRFLLAVLVLVLAFPAGLVGLMSTEAGSRFLLQAVFWLLPAEVSVKTVEGRLLDRLALHEFAYQTDAEKIALQRLLFVWEPSRLFSGKLKIDDIHLDKLDVQLPETAEPEKADGFDINAKMKLPLDIVIENLLLTDAVIRQDGRRQQLDKLLLSAFTENGRLTLAALDVNAPPLTATAKGRMELGGGYPFKLTADWQLATQDHGLWQAAASVDGDFHEMSFNHRLSSPFVSVAQGRLKNLQDKPSLTLRVDWQKLSWPFTKAAPEMSSEQGYFELAGRLDDYRMTLDAELARPSLPPGHLTFKGKGGEKSLSITGLELQSTAGQFRLSGDVVWNGATMFDLTAAGRQFNPAVLVPELPGSLTFNTRLKGKMDGASLSQLEADIDEFSGKLRGNPVSAGGTLVWTGNQLLADALKLFAGKNKIALNGVLGPEKAEFDVAVDAPDLAALWPDLGGSLKGEGKVQGTLKKPEVSLNAKGNGLRFAEHGAERITVDIDYHAGTEKTSRMQLSASGIETGARQIEQLRISGTGTLEKHRFTADISSSDGELASVLNGYLKDGEWRGEVSRLDLKSPDFGRWHLKDHLSVLIAKKPEGFDASVSKACLLRQDASLCGEGRYFADGDFRFNAKAASLPLSLIDVFLPDQTTVKGIIDADAAVERQKGLLTGNFQVTVPANATVLVKKEQRSAALVLGASSLSGKLEGTRVSADFDLALADRDYLRGAVQFDTGKTKALSGRLKASVANLAVLKPFVPQISDIKGALSADLAWEGTPAKPVITGTAVLDRVTVEMADSGFGLRGINLEAVALGGPGNRIRLHGGASPVALPRQGALERWEFKGTVNVSADLERKEGLFAGAYRIEVPAPASIVLKTEDASTTISLTESTLSGRFEGTISTAELNLAMAARDYVRAQLRLDAGEKRTLSGLVTASVTEFALLNPFVPELSDLKGDLKADLVLAGSIDKPDVNGTVDLTQGSAHVIPLGVKVSEVKLHALASSDRAEAVVLNGSAKSGQGYLELQGSADREGAAKLNLNGKDFEVAKMPEAQIAVSPELTLAFAEGHGKVTGDLKVPKAIMQLRELPENAVKVSKDEVILGEETAEAAAAPAIDIDVDIVVELGKQVRFSGMGLDTDLAGKLKVTKTGQKMAMYGIVDMKKARYKSYGQDLTVRKGRFIFNGPVDKPLLDVEAIRVAKSRKVTAILTLSGPLDAPRTQISSEPALPEADALAYLVTGRPLNEVSKAEGNVLAGAALSYGVGRASWIADKLGVEEFEVEEGQTLQDTLVSVGQYLTPDFYVGSKVGLFNKQAVMVLKHKLTDRVNVETQAGTSQRIKLNYEFDTD